MSIALESRSLCLFENFIFLLIFEEDGKHLNDIESLKISNLTFIKVFPNNMKHSNAYLNLL